MKLHLNFQTSAIWQEIWNFLSEWKISREIVEDLEIQIRIHFRFDPIAQNIDWLDFFEFVPKYLMIQSKDVT